MSRPLTSSYFCQNKNLLIRRPLAQHTLPVPTIPSVGCQHTDTLAYIVAHSPDGVNGFLNIGQLYDRCQPRLNFLRKPAKAEG